MRENKVYLVLLNVVFYFSWHEQDSYEKLHQNYSFLEAFKSLSLKKFNFLL